MSGKTRSMPTPASCNVKESSVVNPRRDKLAHGFQTFWANMLVSSLSEIQLLLKTPPSTKLAPCAVNRHRRRVHPLSAGRSGGFDNKPPPVSTVATDRHARADRGCWRRLGVPCCLLFALSMQDGFRIPPWRG